MRRDTGAVKTVRQLLRNETRCHHMTSNSPSEHTPKGWKARIPADVCTPVFIAVLFTGVKRGGVQPRCPSSDEWIKKCGIAIRWNMIVIKRNRIVTKSCVLQCGVLHLLCMRSEQGVDLHPYMFIHSLNECFLISCNESNTL